MTIRVDFLHKTNIIYPISQVDEKINALDTAKSLSLQKGKLL